MRANRANPAARTRQRRRGPTSPRATVSQARGLTGIAQHRDGRASDGRAAGKLSIAGSLGIDKPMRRRTGDVDNGDALTETEDIAPTFMRSSVHERPAPIS
jgi:hypothetical protein